MGALCFVMNGQCGMFPFSVSFVIPHKPSSIMEGMVCLMLNVWAKKPIEIKKNEIESL